MRKESNVFEVLLTCLIVPVCAMGLVARTGVTRRCTGRFEQATIWTLWPLI
jgi:hypothetical protein